MHTGSILNPPEPDHWHLEGVEPVINPLGDWTHYKPKNEAQSTPAFDTQGCAVFGTLKAWIVLAQFLGFEFTKDASERYTGSFAGTNENGTDPHVVAEVTRETCGLIPAEVMPWTDDLDTLEEYYDKRMAQSLLPLGSKLLDRYELNHAWVFSFGSPLSPADKQEALQDALTRGTVCVSVDGRYRKNGKYYTKDKGVVDTHWVLLLKHDGKHGTFHDQYSPFVKQLDQDYDHSAAKVYSLSKKAEKSRNFFSTIWDLFLKRS